MSEAQDRTRQALYAAMTIAVAMSAAALLSLLLLCAPQEGAAAGTEQVLDAKIHHLGNDKIPMSFRYLSITLPLII